MTTIKLKNGSGAPAASDLVQGEPALDLTNKRLYTEDSGGSVIEIGTNPTSLTTGTFTSTGIDDNATSTAITIDSSENVGIGTTSPDESLVVQGGVKIRGTNKLSFTNTSDQTYIQAASSNVLAFGTDSTERMRIDSSGNVLVGQTNASTVVNGAYFRTNGSGFIATSTDCLMLNRQGTDGTVVDIRNDNTTVGTISISGSSTAYNTSSDERLKENIVDAPAGNIDDIRVRSFDWKADGSHQTYGMVAQELVDVAPEAVSQGETEDDMWGVDYSKLVPMMIKEIQDLKAEVAALKGA